MKLVIVESPLFAPTTKEVDRNIDYARACLRDCLSKGEAPLASHLLYTQPGVLDDKKPEERKRGMEAGFAWTEQCASRMHACVVYTDRGISDGMQQGITIASKARIPLEFRKLGGTWNK